MEIRGNVGLDGFFPSVTYLTHIGRSVNYLTILWSVIGAAAQVALPKQL